MDCSSALHGLRIIDWVKNIFVAEDFTSNWGIYATENIHLLPWRNKRAGVPHAPDVFYPD